MLRLAPIKKLQADAYEKFNAAMAEHSEQAELEKLKKTVKKTEIKKSLAKNKVVELADIKALLKPDEVDGAPVPVLKRYLTNNSTYEALGELHIENPIGLLVEVGGNHWAPQAA